MISPIFRRRKEAHRKRLGSLSIEYFAKEAGIIPTTFRSWYSMGTRLVYLAAAGQLLGAARVEPLLTVVSATPFVLLLLAASAMRVEVTRSKYSSMEDISGLAVLLRCPTGLCVIPD